MNVDSLGQLCSCISELMLQHLAQYQQNGNIITGILDEIAEQAAPPPRCEHVFDYGYSILLNIAYLEDHHNQGPFSHSVSGAVVAIGFGPAP